MTETETGQEVILETDQETDTAEAPTEEQKEEIFDLDEFAGAWDTISPYKLANLVTAAFKHLGVTDDKGEPKQLRPQQLYQYARKSDPPFTLVQVGDHRQITRDTALEWAHKYIASKMPAARVPRA